jgi:hypothetical protein
MSDPMIQRERLARRMSRVNGPMRFVLGLPFATPLSKQLMLLSYVGRKTGRAYRQPVSYIVDGDTLLTPGGGRWKLNLRDGEPITVRRRGRDETATPELVRDAVEVERLLRVMLTRNRRLASFVPFVAADGTIDRDQMDVALRHGFCIVRWHVDPSAS